jgi:hypothetical protein
MAYVTRYHKARTSTNKEFNVARFLAPRPGLLLFYYLVYILRFSKMLLRESGMASRPEPSTSLLFYSDETPGTPWKASRLISVLRRMSEGVLAKPVGIRLYRQLSIGITEKHVKEVFQPFNRHDDRSSGADLNVSLAWQSAHRPLLRADNYGLDGAFPTKLQPSLLRVYEWASNRWQGFLNNSGKIPRLGEGLYPHEVKAGKVIEGNCQHWEITRNRELEGTLDKRGINLKEIDGRAGAMELGTEYLKVLLGRKYCCVWCYRGLCAMFGLITPSLFDYGP